MTAYLIVDTKIIDQKAYEDYKIRAKPIVEHTGVNILLVGVTLQSWKMNYGRPLD